MNPFPLPPNPRVAPKWRPSLESGKGSLDDPSTSNHFHILQSGVDVVDMVPPMLEIPPPCHDHVNPPSAPDVHPIVDPQAIAHPSELETNIHPLSPAPYSDPNLQAPLEPQQPTQDIEMDLEDIRTSTPPSKPHELPQSSLIHQFMPKSHIIK